jgi:hypothetical protein
MYGKVQIRAYKFAILTQDTSPLKVVPDHFTVFPEGILL